MRHLPLSLVGLLGALLLAPSAVAAQEPPIDRCDVDCWWPAGPVAQLDELKAAVDVTDGASVARYRMTLGNASDSSNAGPAEGRIVFPVPAGSSVTDLVLSGGPETLEGTLLGTDEATRLYQEIVLHQIDPALLRSLGQDLYEVRAFPVPMGEQRTVSFTVTTPLLAEGGQSLVEVPWSRMSPLPMSANVSIDTDVSWEVRSALAPGFDLASERTGPGSLELAWEAPHGWTADSDFRLYLGGGSGLIDTRLLAHRDGDEDGYFALLFAPSVEVDAVVPRDLVLVLDVSGSMEGEKIEQAKSAAEYVLDHLGAEDRFAVVSFSHSVNSYADGLSPASDAPAAVDYVRGLQAGGDTNISGALGRGLSLLNGDRPGTLIFLTDGLPTSGIEDRDGIVDLARQTAAARTQMFTFGVGYDVDPVLLDALSTELVGSSHYVTPEERIDTEVQKLYEQVSVPVLTDVEVAIDGSVVTSDIAPQGMNGIFAGNQALLTGRYSGSGDATVIVTGNSATGPARFEYPVHFPDHASGDAAVAQLWAQRRVADLLTEVRIEGARDSLIEEIVDLATRFGIVTPYTSYLAQEPDMAFSPEMARQSVNDAVAAAPTTGVDAVGAAEDLEALRDGKYELGGSAVRVIGDHAYYWVDDAWVRDGYDAKVDAPEVVVGTETFLALVQADAGIAEAAALGSRVITEGPNGWITIVWLDPAG